MDYHSGTDEFAVRELINGLKSAYQDEEFNKVELILLSREENLRRELDQWKDKCQVIEKENGVLALAKVLAEDEKQKAQQELEICQNTFKALESRITRVVENVHRVLPNSGPREEAVVPEKIGENGIRKVKEEPSSSQQGEVSGLRHVGQQSLTNRSVSRKAVESLPEKQAEATMKASENWKASGSEAVRGNLIQSQVKKEPERFQNGSFISPPHLHGHGQDLTNHGGSKKAAESLPEKLPQAMMMKASEKRKASEIDAVACRGNLLQPQVREEPNGFQNGGVSSPHPLHENGQGQHSVVMGCSNGKPSQRPSDSKAGTSVSAPVIEIDDSDDEMEICMPNIVASNVVSCTEVNSVRSDGNGKSCSQIPLHAPSFKRKRDGSCSGGSELTGADRLIASLDKKVKVKPPIDWTSEVDMTVALTGNEGLRMRGVCALYRQMHSNVKPASYYCLSIKDQVEQSDALSIARLGKYLIEGGKLKDNVPDGRKCYALVMRYTKQLCEICKKGLDPYFPVYKPHLL